MWTTPDLCVLAAPAAGWREIAAELAAGYLVLLLVSVDGDLGQARSVCRATCAEIVAALAPHVLHVSRSATAGLAAIALSARAAVGIDVERIRPDLVDNDLLALALHPHERLTQPDDVQQAFFGLWTRKEASLKALGTGLATAPHMVACGWSGETWLPVLAAIPGLYVRSVPAPAGFAAALACAGEPPAVRCWSW